MIPKRFSSLDEARRCDACGACNPCGPGYPAAPESRLPRGAIWRLKTWLDDGASPRQLAARVGTFPLFGAAERACPQKIPISRVSLELRARQAAVSRYAEIAKRISQHVGTTKNALGVTSPHWDWAGKAIRARIGEGANVMVLGGTLNSFHPDLHGGPLNPFCEVLRKLGVNFRLFGPSEPYLGWESLCAGDREGAVKAALSALVKLKVAGCETVISPDSAVVCCIGSFWPMLLEREIPFQILHATDFLSGYVDSPDRRPDGKVVQLHPGDESFIAGIDVEAVMSTLETAGFEVSNRLFIDRDPPCPCCGCGLPPARLPEPSAGTAAPLAVMTTSCRFARHDDRPVVDITSLLSEALLS